MLLPLSLSQPTCTSQWSKIISHLFGLGTQYTYFNPMQSYYLSNLCDFRQTILITTEQTAFQLFAIIRTWGVNQCQLHVVVCAQNNSPITPFHMLEQQLSNFFNPRTSYFFRVFMFFREPPNLYMYFEKKTCT